ncbi:hypothetical protein STRCI_000773 [Streptomyces cinnabarinus]|uniref:Uncharacterized protein n=1 Tax=Streptomyces cinnabarinus TaxID=67287 RepID=A0ABY7KVA5_9ACTN|nr:hypothetical protein [Streptomyces cinnabarinus]WAZ27357.1 hypothetical protein STRCI_000773 [Streptomyces cinnabarinus]
MLQYEAGDDARATAQCDQRQQPMWSVGAGVRARRAERAVPVEPFTAGVFIATMTAEIDEFAEHGHPWSEIVNE